MCWCIPEDHDGPWDICADTAHAKLYCGNWPGGVSVVDLSRRAVTANLAPGSVDVTPVSGCTNPVLDKNYILLDDGELLVLDAEADTVITSVKLDSTLRWSLSACAARAGRVFVAAPASGVCVLVDCVRDSVAGTVRFDHPVRVVQAGIDDMTFTVATAGCTYVVDPMTGSILRRLYTGSDPAAICYAPDLHKLYCADRGRRLYVASTLSDSVLGHLDLEDRPYDLCYDPTDSRLYISGELAYSDSLTVLDCTSDTVVARIDLGTSGRRTHLVYSKYGNRVYFGSGDSLGIIDCGFDSVVGWLPRLGSSPPNLFPALGLGAVTAGYIMLFNDPPARSAVVAPVQVSEPTVASGRLYAVGFGYLYDLAGKKMLNLLPGWNNVSEIAPGIYFAREQTMGGKAAKARKVVILSRTP